jgi:tryptophan synthase alpha chain
MGHVVADFPSPDAVRRMLAVMAEAGAEVIEIQVPFSEPVADGPLFLAANHAALAAGVTLARCHALMREASAAYPHVQFVYMSYLNVPFKAGYAAFARDAAAAGARGAIVPDLPLEHEAPVQDAFAGAGLSLVRLIAPNASDARLAQLTQRTPALIYAVARAGVTGSPSALGADLAAFVGRIRAHTEAPVAVGFGIGSAADLARLRGIADLGVIGTASLRTWQASGEAGLKKFWGELAAAAR